MNTFEQSPSFGALVGISVGTSMAIVGYVLAVSEHESYGVVIFCLLPFLTGFSIAAFVQPKHILAASLMTVAFLSAAILILTGLEGYICVFMAAPIMAAVMALGAFIGYVIFTRIRKRRLNESQTLLLIFMMPILMAAAEHVERPLRNQQRRETFTTSPEIAASPEQVWSSLTHFSKLTGPKPFLLAIGLPVPTECTLQHQDVGAERVCRFDQGEIVQQVTELTPNVSLKVAVTNCTLPGRRWLQFIDAGYELTPTANGTKVTRYSTIGSRLYPRWYWRPFEAWAVTSEHHYVLGNVKRTAERAAQK